MRRLPPAALSALAILILIGCATDGRTMAAPGPNQTTTTRPPPPTSAPPQQAADSGLTLSSPAFEPGGFIPESATCRGVNVFPDLEWGDVGPDAVELAVTLSDQTDPQEPVLLWLLAGIRPDETGLTAGVVPEEAVETTDDYGITGYGEPCLDTFAEGRRDLQFRLYVLGAPSGLDTGHPGNEAWDTVEAAAFESSSLLAFIDNPVSP